jgi:hypothetical protein
MVNTLSNRQWRIVAGTINAVAAFLLIQPTIQQYPIAMLCLGALVAGLGYMQAPTDAANG